MLGLLEFANISQQSLLLFLVSFEDLRATARHTTSLLCSRISFFFAQFSKLIPVMNVRFFILVTRFGEFHEDLILLLYIVNLIC